MPLGLLVTRWKVNYFHRDKGARHLEAMFVKVSPALLCGARHELLCCGILRLVEPVLSRVGSNTEATAETIGPMAYIGADKECDHLVASVPAHGAVWHSARNKHLWTVQFGLH